MRIAALIIAVALGLRLVDMQFYRGRLGDAAWVEFMVVSMDVTKEAKSIGLDALAAVNHLTRRG